MALQNFDQLNSMSTKWFSKMNVSDAEKKKRVDLSLEYCEIIIMLFMLIEGNHPRESCVDFLEERLRIIAENVIGKSNIAYINDWSRKEAEKVVDDTLKHINDEPEYKLIKTDDGGTKSQEKTFNFEEFDIKIPQSEYWTSELRALLVGIGCASAIANYHVLWYALERGMTNKVWITEADEKVRKTHQEVDHTDIPINELFIVGNSYLMFPGDVNYGAEEKEVDGCRCHLEFYKR